MTLWIGLAVLIVAAYIAGLVTPRPTRIEDWLDGWAPSRIPTLPTAETPLAGTEPLLVDLVDETSGILVGTAQLYETRVPVAP